ncbi:MAG: calycin-like domain-containing protein [Bacteroidales bacterium]|nr:calycin-like domain-containing protein [Bacteroidales bacterium]
MTLIYYNTLSTLTYDGTAIELEDGKTSYDLSAYEYDASLLSYTLKGVGAYATSSYDETTGVLTLTVMGNDYKASVNDPDTYTVYTIQFGYTVEKTYSNTLMVDVSGQRTAPSEDNITLISVYENSENSYSLQLKNFSFNGWLIGDILVTDLTRTENEDGSINYAATDQLVKLDGMGGISLPVTVDANVVDDELTATITISDAGVVVTFAPSITISSDADVNVEAGLKNVTFNRDFNAGWSTLCLPFDYSVTDLGATYAQEFSDADENGLDFSQVSTMEANKPYLVYFSDAVTSTPIYFGVEVKEPSPIVVDKNGYTFQGNYKYNFSMAGLYGVVNTDSDQYQYIRRGGTNSTLNATGAYFTLPSTSSAQSMVLNLSGEITSIDSVVTDGSANGPVYNLQGIRVSNSSLDNLPKGIYMQNGKKIYVK